MAKFLDNNGLTYLWGKIDLKKQNKLIAGDNIDISNGIISTVDRMPIGSINLWAADTLPDGWILCDGSSITGNEYEDLRNVLDSSVVPNISGLTETVNYIIKYKFCIPGGVVPPPPPVSVIYATFEDYDGSVLYVLELNAGETPSYQGAEPSRQDTYDAEEDLWTEYTFDGWNPAIGPIYASTVFTAQYSTRQYRLVEVIKYVKETAANASSTKNYLLVTNGSLLGNVVINADWNAGKYFNIYTGEMTEVAFISEITEFQIADAELPSHFLSLEYNDNNYRIKDLDDNGYLIASTGNTFNSKQYDPTTLDNNWLWTLMTDSTGVYLQNIGLSTRIIQYNSSYTRFAPYKNTLVNVYLFYKSVTVEKQYINGTRGLLKGSSNSLNIPTVTNLTYVEGKDEDESR